MKRKLLHSQWNISGYHLVRFPSLLLLWWMTWFADQMPFVNHAVEQKRLRFTVLFKDKSVKGSSVGFWISQRPTCIDTKLCKASLYLLLSSLLSFNASLLSCFAQGIRLLSNINLLWPARCQGRRLAACSECLSCSWFFQWATPRLQSHVILSWHRLTCVVCFILISSSFPQSCYNIIGMIYHLHMCFWRASEWLPERWTMSLLTHSHHHQPMQRSYWQVIRSHSWAILVFSGNVSSCESWYFPAGVKTDTPRLSLTPLWPL